MSEEVKTSIAWEPFVAIVCFVVAVISLIVGFVFTTGWLLDGQVHSLLHGVGVVLLIIGMPVIILGGHFMDLSEKKAKRLGLIIVIFVLGSNPLRVNAQDFDVDDGTSQQQETQTDPPKWQYGGFVDVAYPLNFNHPGNHLFRSRGTAFHTDSVWLNTFIVSRERTVTT
jgi:hypothetical protein